MGNILQCLREEYNLDENDDSFEDKDNNSDNEKNKNNQAINFNLAKRLSNYEELKNVHKTENKIYADISGIYDEEKDESATHYFENCVDLQNKLAKKKSNSVYIPVSSNKIPSDINI